MRCMDCKADPCRCGEGVPAPKCVPCVMFNERGEQIGEGLAIKHEGEPWRMMPGSFRPIPVWHGLAPDQESTTKMDDEEVAVDHRYVVNAMAPRPADRLADLSAKAHRMIAEAMALPPEMLGIERVQDEASPERVVVATGETVLKVGDAPPGSLTYGDWIDLHGNVIKPGGEPVPDYREQRLAAALDAFNRHEHLGKTEAMRKALEAANA